jgi:hypothetical protein
MKCDILIGNNNWIKKDDIDENRIGKNWIETIITEKNGDEINIVGKKGYLKNHTEDEMIDLATKQKCPIIIKNGKNGKWYLRGKGYTIENLKNKIDENLGKSRDDVFCLLLE